MASTSELDEAVRAIQLLAAEAVEAFGRSGAAADLEAARVEYLGQKRGRLRDLQDRYKAALGSWSVDQKREFGKQLNAAKTSLEAKLETARARLARPARAVVGLDVTRPGTPRPRLGHRHPLTQTAEELLDVFGRLGFSAARGPEVEDVFHNFEALNIPAWHPARDPQDNFYLPGGLLLRSQTSTVQIRVMERQSPPVRVVAIGRVYRPDAVDATHSFMFHQIEGLYVDRCVTMADLKTVLRLFAESYLGQDVKIRFRPSFFPFTEPSVEVDMVWHEGQRWVEMGGAGMVDPNVLRAVGYDPETVTGFAFGLGIERLCMRRHGIDDIRLLYQNDVRFLAQF